MKGTKKNNDTHHGKPIAKLGFYGIVVEFMGVWDDLANYRFLTEKLLDEEMDDIHIKDMFYCRPSTLKPYWVWIMLTPAAHFLPEAKN